MRNGKLLIPILLLLSITLMPLLGSSVAAQTKAERKAALQRTVEQRVDEKSLKIEVSRALPARGPSVSLNDDYSLIIRNDSVISYLPYYGRVYSAQMGGGENLMFSAKIEEYTVLREKRKYKIEFTARTQKETCKFRLQIGVDGGGSVSVDSNHREEIRFIGELDTTPKQEKRVE